MILHFNPQPPIRVLVACAWDPWVRRGSPDLYSFATIIDEPPPEIAKTGHTRCIIVLKEENLREWLSPVGRLERTARANPR